MRRIRRLARGHFGNTRRRARRGPASRSTRRRSWISGRPSARARIPPATGVRSRRAAAHSQRARSQGCRRPGTACHGGFAARTCFSCSGTGACSSNGARRAVSGAGSGCRRNFPRLNRPRPGLHRDSRVPDRQRDGCRCFDTRSRISISTSSPGCSRSLARRTKWRKRARAGTNLPHCIRSDCRRRWQDC